MPSLNKHIPFLNFQPAHAVIKDEMMKAFEDVYDNCRFILGERLSAFEATYSKFNEVKFTVGVSNGLDALFLALKSLNIGSGDEVIVPSNTYIATVLAVLHAGATPVFVEPDINTCNIDPQKIEAAITPKTKVIIPVHLYGQACEMGKIAELANKNSLHIVEDNAQSHGASFKDIKTGSWGIVNATSFYPGKNLGALGDGGAITTNDEALTNKLRMLRNYGSEKKYYNEISGYNMRLDELQAALLSVKLKYLASWTIQRQQIAAGYDEGLQGIDGLVLPCTHPDATHVYHLYVIRSDKRDHLSKHLSANGIDTLIHYPVPPHLQKALGRLGYRKGDFPIAEKLANTCLSLPVWPGMEQNDIAYIIETIKKFYE
ncbi:MAG: DegT/DnrJ/EryC1/StrS family aminotransferase [Chitinophagales bacterium]